MTFGQETRWAYSAMLPIPHGAELLSYLPHLTRSVINNDDQILFMSPNHREQVLL